MGEVHRAYDADLDRVVALKVLPVHASADPEFRERFRREARTTARLRNPHIIPLHNYGDIDGRLFLEMPLIDGVDAKELLREAGPFAPARAVSIVEQAADALDAAHAAGLVHRDVKPANLLVTGKDFVYLIDFGIARSEEDTGLTGVGAAIGTFAYMAPERMSGGGADVRSDVYSLACVLHECLTGSKPYPGSSVEQQITAHLTGPPPRPSSVQPGVPAAFDQVVAKGMAKDPAQRYQSAGELAAAARQALVQYPPPGAAAPQAPVWQVEPPPLSAPGSPYERSTVSSHVPVPRRRGWLPVTALLLVLVLAGAFAYWKLLSPTGDEGGPGSTGLTTPAPLPATTVLTTVAVGNTPVQVALDHLARRAYVTNYHGSSVSVLDTTTNTVVGTVQVGFLPAAVAVDPRRGTVFVAETGGTTVSMIDVETNAVTGTAEVGFRVTDIEVHPDDGTVYLADGDGGAITVLDAATLANKGQFVVGGTPWALALDKERRVLYISDISAGIVRFYNVDAQTEEARVLVGQGPKGIAFDPSRQRIYTANEGDSSVTVVDASSREVVATISVGSDPKSVAVDVAAGAVYVTNGSDNTVSVIDGATNTSRATVYSGEGPTGVAVDPDSRHVYVVNSGGSVTVLEP